MKTRFLILTTAVALSALFTSSCGLLKKGATRGEAYAKIYSEAPISILVMPPINETNKVDAKEAVYATLYRPLVDRGYYVFRRFSRRNYFSLRVLMMPSALLMER